jgi:hypothetical protein
MDADWYHELRRCPQDVAREVSADWDDGNYFSNSYQLVTDDDARELAAALDLALGEIPTEEMPAGPFDGPEYGLPHGTPSEEVTRVRAQSPDAVVLVDDRAYLPDGTVVGMREYFNMRSEQVHSRAGVVAFFSGEGSRAFVKKFADFARAGRFRIG